MKIRLFTLIITLMLFLSACEFPPSTEEPGPNPAPVEEIEASDVAEPEPEPEQEEEEVVKEEPAETEPEVSEAEASGETDEEHCLELLTPLDLADLPAEGKVVFTWTAHPEADSYSLNFIFPDGLELNFTADETSKNRYMDGFSMHPAYNQSGEHQWNVSALNAAGEELCQSGFLTFTKLLSGDSSSNSNDNGNNACAGPGCNNGGNAGH